MKTEANRTQLRKPRLHPVFAACLAVFLAVSSGDYFAARAADASPPKRMSFQSYLTDDNGVAVGNTAPANKKMVFTLFTAETGGTSKWAEEQIVTVDKGYFSVILGEGGPVGTNNTDLAAAFVGTDISDRYMEIKVSNTDGTSPQTLAPRMRMLPSAYSFMAGFATQAGSLSSALGTGGLQDSSVTTAKLANGAVNSDKILDLSIQANDLDTDSVTKSKIGDLAVGAAELDADAVTTAKIKNGEVKKDDLGSSSVDSSKIQDGSIATADIANQAVTLGKMSAGMFKFTKYSKNLTSQTATIATDKLVSEYYPCLMGFNFGNVDVDESGDNNGWAVSIYPESIAPGAKWEIKIAGPTHDNHIDAVIRVLWIPVHLVSAETEL